MCGIVGYVGNQPAAPLLLAGLASLEYRGYDSAGIALLDAEDRIVVWKAAGKLNSLVESMKTALPQGTVGIGHTRWATHGIPNDVNAHPHLDCSQKVVIVHNGIVENYQELKDELLGQGHRFNSETDSEVIVHLIESSLKSGAELTDAVGSAAVRLRGASAVVAMAKKVSSRA